jgi:hypothetical protein
VGRADADDDEYAHRAAGGRRAEIYAAEARWRTLRRADPHARIPKIKRRVSGYNLDQLLPENGFNVARALVGTEGTCAITLQAKTRLVRARSVRVLLVLGLSRHLSPPATRCRRSCRRADRLRGSRREASSAGCAAAGCAADIALLPPGNAWMMIEFGADTVEAGQRAGAGAGRPGDARAGPMRRRTG